MSDAAPPGAPPGPPPRRGGRFGAVVSIGAVGVVAAAWAVTVAGRELAAPPALLAGLVVFLPYLYLLGAIVIFAGWTAAPDRRTPPLALAALVASALWLWVPGRTSAVDDPAGRVRVVSWNVQRLWGRPDAAVCVEETLAAEAPDVAVLLEVSARDVQRLADAVGLDCRHHTYTSDARPDRGGLATCARRGGAWQRGRWDSARFVDDEDWYYQLAEFTRGDRRVNVLATHLYPYRGVARQLTRAVTEPSSLAALGDRGEVVSRGQSDQAVALLARVASLKDPTVVAGDLNSTPDAALHVALRHSMRDAWTAAGTGFGGTVRLFGLPLRVDYVYVSPPIGVRDVRVPGRACADHAPVVADLVVPAEE